MLGYNTSCHSTTATTPFELLFGIKPWLPSLPVPEMERKHYGKSFAMEILQILQQMMQQALQMAQSQHQKYLKNVEQKAARHQFKISQNIWLSETKIIGKNAKLTPNGLQLLSLLLRTKFVNYVMAIFSGKILTRTIAKTVTVACTFFLTLRNIICHFFKWTLAYKKVDLTFFSTTEKPLNIWKVNNIKKKADPTFFQLSNVWTKNNVQTEGDPTNLINIWLTKKMLIRLPFAL